MRQSIAHVALVAADHDEAIAFKADRPGFEVPYGTRCALVGYAGGSTGQG